MADEGEEKENEDNETSIAKRYINRRGERGKTDKDGKRVNTKMARGWKENVKRVGTRW